MANDFIECSYATRQSQEDIICSVSPVDVQFSIELGEPWASVPSKSQSFLHHNSIFEILPLFFKEKIKAGVNYFAQNEFSIVNHTRIFYFQKSQNEFSDYKKIELLVPNEDFKDAILSLKEFQLEGNEGYKKWELKEFANCIELFICTHGQRDNCCGKYGLKAYNQFKEENSKRGGSLFRIWKSTHIGGHRYSPTFFEAPSMRWYGLFELDSVPHFLERRTNSFQIVNNYRGANGISNAFVQLAEKELFKIYSWSWATAHNKKYEILVDDNCNNAKIVFYYSLQNTESIMKKTFEVQFAKLIKGIAGCGSEDLKTVKQYTVTEIVEMMD